MTQLNLNQAVNLARQAVEERGEDYRYEAPPGTSCAYFHGSEPGCLVGYMLHLLGYSKSDLWCSRSNESSVIVLAAHQPELLGIDNGVVTFLRELQAKQDGGLAWGRALESTLRQLGILNVDVNDTVPTPNAQKQELHLISAPVVMQKVGFTQKVKNILHV